MSQTQSSENERTTEGEGPINNASLNKVVGNRLCLQIHGQVFITLCDG